ncbi:MAG: single-stranded DNA-binding protein [Phascolarctobacterium sp.]|nr:single-stranded DNA-binding protein [Phascolarctobacterium sp.]MBR6636896.1 single-stranded DNA-binding protein [Phascolarctobacterium sp.]
MNKIVLLGRLVRDPEVRYTQNGKVVATFTLAVDRPFAGEDGKREADFIGCVIWGKPAELLGNSVGKGQRLLIDGRIQNRSYEAKDGSKRYVTEVICNGFEYIEKKGENGSTGAGDGKAAPADEKADFEAGFGSPVPFDEEIPF